MKAVRTCMYMCAYIHTHETCVICKTLTYIYVTLTDRHTYGIDHNNTSVYLLSQKCNLCCSGEVILFTAVSQIPRMLSWPSYTLNKQLSSE